MSRFADLPVRQFREFVAHTVAEMDRLPALLAEERDKPVIFRITLKLDMDEAVLQEYEVELGRLEELYGVDE